MNSFREAGWRWPLWSWRHLTLTVASAALLVAGLGRISGGGDVMPTALQAGVTQEVVSAPTSSGSSRHLTPSLETPTADAGDLADESPEAVALAFVRAWARPDADNVEWRAACKAYATERFEEVLATATSNTVPASRALEDTEILERAATTARVRVATDGGAILVDLDETTSGWRVDGIQPEQLSVVGPAREG